MAKRGTDETHGGSNKTVKKRRSMTFESAREARSFVEGNILSILPELEERTQKTLTDGSRERIIRQFQRLEQGSKLDARTPLFKHESRKQVVGGFDRIVERNRGALGITPDFPMLFQEVEEGQRANIGPMSMFVPAHVDLGEKIRAVMSDKPLSSNVNARALDMALDDVERLLPPATISRVSQEEAYNGVRGRPETAATPDTNSGWPYCMRDWNVDIKPAGPSGGARGSSDARERADMWQDILVSSREFIRNASKGCPPNELVDEFVALSFQRTVQKGPDQLKSPKSKRLVLGMPKSEVIAGKTIQIPLQQALKQVRNTNGVFIFPGFHPRPVMDVHLQGFLATAHNANRTPLSGDISGYDQSLSPEFMWLVAQRMAKWMTKETANLFLGLMYADIYKTGVLSPVGYFPPCPSSIKSGSIFTSIGGCIWNYAIQRYGHHAGYYDLEQCCIMGDDFIKDGDGVDPHSNAAAFSDLGMEAHPDKQAFFKDAVHFLQATSVYGIPGAMGSVYRVLGSCLSVEDDTTMDWDERNRYAFQLQAIQKLNNAIFNPLAPELISYVQTGDKFRLGADRSPSEIVAKGGTYVTRKLRDMRAQHWKVTTDIKFEDWAINRVLRGEKLPPPGVELWEMVYGRPFKLDLYSQ